MELVVDVGDDDERAHTRAHPASRPCAPRQASTLHKLPHDKQAHCTSPPHAQHEDAQHGHTPHERSAQAYTARAHTRAHSASRPRRTPRPLRRDARTPDRGHGGEALHEPHPQAPARRRPQPRAAPRQPPLTSPRAPRGLCRAQHAQTIPGPPSFLLSAFCAPPWRRRMLRGARTARRTENGDARRRDARPAVRGAGVPRLVNARPRPERVCQSLL